MGKRALLVGILLAAISAGPAAGAEIPGKIVLKVYPKKQVAFDHKGHAGRIGDCRKCHHQDSPGDEVKCSECHLVKKDGSTPSFREAMHRKCRNCHSRDGKKVKGSCNECHPDIKASK